MMTGVGTGSHFKKTVDEFRVWNHNIRTNNFSFVLGGCYHG